MKFLCIFITLVVLCEVHAGTKRMCGPVLVQVLESVCINGYNPMITKKSVPVRNEFDVLDIYNDVDDDVLVHGKSSVLEDLLMGDHVNNFAKTRRRRNLLGIYDECCVKGCNFAELYSYCK